MKTRDAWISDWNPEDNKFWGAEGKFVARRNLIFSILAEHIGFSIWLMWSIVVTKLPAAGFHYRPISSFSWSRCPALSARSSAFLTPSR
jgi:MFS transporter, NNP family, nitrate/nitrite transporter